MDNQKADNKTLNKHEKFVCEFAWGCVPIDVSFVRNSGLFKQKAIEFEKPEIKKIWYTITFVQ